MMHEGFTGDDVKVIRQSLKKTSKKAGF